jgi:hypothetical protein
LNHRFHLSLPQAENDSYLATKNASASIDAKTSGGRVESELPLSSTELAEHAHLRGAINGGGEPVVLRTSGGSIHVEPLR